MRLPQTDLHTWVMRMDARLMLFMCGLDMSSTFTQTKHGIMLSSFSAELKFPNADATSLTTGVG